MFNEVLYYVDIYHKIHHFLTVMRWFNCMVSHWSPFRDRNRV